MSIRTERVSDEIQKVLSERLVRGLRDPMPGFVTIVDVQVASDFSWAKVFVSVIGSPAQKAASIELLKKARGYLRGEVGRAVKLRQTPNLDFILDDSGERASRVMHLLDEEAKEIAARHAPPPPPPKPSAPPKAKATKKASATKAPTKKTPTKKPAAKAKP